MVRIEPKGTVVLLERRQAKNPRGKQLGYSDLKNNWGTQGGDYSSFLDTSLRGSIHRHLSLGINDICHFPPQPFNMNTEPPAGSKVASTVAV